MWFIDLNKISPVILRCDINVSLLQNNCSKYFYNAYYKLSFRQEWHSCMQVRRFFIGLSLKLKKIMFPQVQLTLLLGFSCALSGRMLGAILHHFGAQALKFNDFAYWLHTLTSITFQCDDHLCDRVIQMLYMFKFT